jgi:hypothetical protein
MEKCSDTSTNLYARWSMPERLWTDMKEEIHNIQKLIFLKWFLFFPYQISDKKTETLCERYKEISYKRNEDKKSIFLEFFLSHEKRIL